VRSVQKSTFYPHLDHKAGHQSNCFRVSSVPLDFVATWMW